MFYVSGRGWVAAGDLNVGDEVYLIDGSAAYITGAELEQLAEPVTVYNLEVEGLNTYFVGDEAVLVHNYENKTTKGFWKDYDKLSPEEQRAAKEAYAMFKQNPNHPGLNFEDVTVGNNPRTFSVRINRGLRAYARLLKDNVLEWFEINRHDYKSIRR
ncbi:MAG: hypothetical protein J6X56_01925 [Ruminococcus sp.]|nr:hypothetical protein [Ruminococcus sp.]